MPKVNLTQKFIDHNLICPAGKKSIELNCRSLSGFYVSVTAKSPGIGTYVQSYKDSQGQRRHIKISRTSDLTLKEARNRGKAIRSRIALFGADHAEENRQRKQVITWDEFFEQRYLPYAKQHKRSWKDDEKLHSYRISARFGHLPLDQITRQDVQQWHSELRSNRAASTANHYVRLMKHCFVLAESWSLLAKPNPLIRIPLFKEESRETFLSAEQVKDLMIVIDRDRCRVPCLVVKMLLNTGLRKNSVLSLTWNCVDRKANTVSIDSSNNKSGKRLTIPLNSGALSVLDELSTENTSEYLFTNSKNGQRLQSIDKVWQRLRKEAGLPHIRLHDLRHTFASMLINSGRSLYEVQRLIGHSSASVTTERYAHLTNKTLQEATDSVTQYLDSALNDDSE
jgi:integrase